MMTKFIRIIKFVKQYRKLGIASFRVSTTSDEFILVVDDKGYYNQIRIQYK